MRWLFRCFEDISLVASQLAFGVLEQAITPSEPPHEQVLAIRGASYVRFYCSA